MVLMLLVIDAVDAESDIEWTYASAVSGSRPAHCRSSVISRLAASPHQRQRQQHQPVSKPPCPWRPLLYAQLRGFLCHHAVHV